MNELLNTLLQTSVAFGIYIIAVVAYNLVSFAKKRSTVKELADIRIKWKTSKFWEGFLDKAFIGLSILMFTVVLQVILHQTGSIDVAGIALTRDSMIVVLYAATVILTGAGVKNIASQLEVSDEDLVKYAKEADEQNYTETLEAVAEEIKELFAPAIEVAPEDIAKDMPVVQPEVDELVSQIGGAVDVLGALKADVGKYLMDSGSGKYQGQCTQVPVEMRRLLGVSTAAMGNGRDVVDNLVRAGLAEYCGNEAGAIWSTKGSEWGHTGVSLGGDYVIEQNVNYGGLPAKNFGVGNTYPVRIGRWSESWRNKTGLVYCRLKAFAATNVVVTPTSEPKPATPAPVQPQTVPNNPTPVADIKVGDSVVAWGVGTADSYGGGATTRNFPRTIMKVIGINNGRYALNQFNSVTVGNVADTTGWWVREQIDKN